jgi:ribosome maturation factor RimP
VNRTEHQLEQLIAPTVEGLGCELWGVEYFPRGKRSMLRVYIDTPDGVSVDDCERVSHQVSSVLDVENPIGAGYTLEVSSPGLDRVLFRPEQYLANLGEEVDVRLKFPVEGRRKITGRLTGMKNTEVLLHIDGKELALPFEQVQKARVVPQIE